MSSLRQAAMSSLRQTTGAIVVALLLGLPPLGLVVGEVTFLFVGRTLRPVEAMSRQAALITSRNDLERGAAMRIGLPPLSVRLSSP